jgi:membrane-associated phospholipid phosphatase
VHHPIDVIGSTIIAAIAVAVAYSLEPRVESLLRRMVLRIS